MTVQEQMVLLMGLHFILGKQNWFGDQIMLMPCPSTCFPSPYERQLLYLSDLYTCDFFYCDNVLTFLPTELF